MDAAAPHFRRFVRRVHRRLVLLRVAEAGGIGLLVGSGFAIVLAGLLLWLGRPAMEAVAGCLLTGLACGCAVGVARGPSVLQAAIRADEQLDLADLLSTALVAAPGGDSWTRTVLYAADARCATLSPSAVLLRRFDGRAWGAIGVGAGLAITLAAFSNGSSEAKAGPARSDGRPSNAARLPPLPTAPALQPLTAQSVERRRTWSDPQDTGRTLGGNTTTARAPAADDPAAPGDAADPDHAGPGSTDATGGGSSATNAKPNPDRARPSPGRPAGTSSTDPAAPVAGGAGAPAPRAGHVDGATGEAAGAAPAAPRPAPVWESATWSRDVESARAAVGAGRVPDAYRDVVRDYFERP